MGLVLLHSGILMRGYVSYVSALLGVVVLLMIPLIESYFPGIRLWAWIKYVVYEVFHIYISMQGYLFLGAFFFLVWLFSLLVYDRRTYIMVTPGAVSRPAGDRPGGADLRRDAHDVRAQAGRLLPPQAPGPGVSG